MPVHITPIITLMAANTHMHTYEYKYRISGYLHTRGANSHFFVR